MDENIRDLPVVIIIDYDDGRLFPLTEGLPKCLLPVANRRLLGIIIIIIIIFMIIVVIIINIINIINIIIIILIIIIIISISIRYVTSKWCY